MRTRDSRTLAVRTHTASAVVRPLWTVKDVAEYLRLQEETVRVMARAGQLEARKVGKLWRFVPAEIEKLVVDRMSEQRRKLEHKTLDERTVKHSAARNSH